MPLSVLLSHKFLAFATAVAVAAAVADLGRSRHGGPSFFFMTNSPNRMY